MQTSRAIYEHGILRLLDAVDLRDGMQVEIRIDTVPATTRIRSLLHDMLRQSAMPEPLGMSEAEAMAQVRKAFSGGSSMSQMIIDERDGR